MAKGIRYLFKEHVVDVRKFAGYKFSEAVDLSIMESDARYISNKLLSNLKEALYYFSGIVSKSVDTIMHLIVSYLWLLALIAIGFTIIGVYVITLMVKLYALLLFPVDTKEVKENGKTKQDKKKDIK